METTTVKCLCSICEKQTRTFICKGCSKEFCRNDFMKHLDSFDKQLDQITNEHNEIVQKISLHKTNPDQSPLLDKINRWEEESIEKIRHIAQEYRNKILKTTKRSIDQVEHQLEDLGKKIKKIRQENDFNEIDLNQCQEKLKQLETQLESPATSLIQRSTSLINQIPLNLSLNKNSKWKHNGIIIGGHGKLINPCGMCITDDQTLYVADRGHHRIMEFKPNAWQGRVVIGGRDLNQLHNPNDVVIDKETNSLIIADQGNRRILRWSLNENTQAGEVLIPNISCSNLAIDQEGSIYVSDNVKHEVRRWKKGEKEGIIVAGGNGQGRQLNQLNKPTYLFIDHEYSLYITDEENCRVMKWTKDAKQGIIVAGNGSASRNGMNPLSEPTGIYVDRFNQVYIADSHKNRIIRWCEREKQGCIVVNSDAKKNIRDHLNGLSSLIFDHDGNLYVNDNLNDRIIKFEMDFD